MIHPPPNPPPSPPPSPPTPPTNQQLFTSDGSFTVPPGVTSVYVTLIGGGQGAFKVITCVSLIYTLNADNGARYNKELISVTPGDVIPVTIGTLGIFTNNLINAPCGTPVGGLTRDMYFGKAPETYGGDSSFGSLIAKGGGKTYLNGNGDPIVGLSHPLNTSPFTTFGRGGIYDVPERPRNGGPGVCFVEWY